MPYLRLNLSDFNSSFGVGDPLHEGWRASWQTGMGWAESVKLSNGSDLAKMSGRLNLRAGEVGSASEKAIGTLSYFPADKASEDGLIDAQPEVYFVEVSLSEAHLLRLMELERQGHGPTGVSVNVPGLQYGVFPDGSDKKWEITGDRNWLAVEALTFSFRKPEEDEPIEAPDEDLPVDAGRSPEVGAIYDVYRDFQKWLMWLCGLLAAILFAVLLKR
jgi:hypothetical protein